MSIICQSKKLGTIGFCGIDNLDMSQLNLVKLDASNNPKNDKKIKITLKFLWDKSNGKLNLWLWAEFFNFWAEWATIQMNVISKQTIS